MSRCFPFPPPGYERKHKPDDLDLLKEAKRREKRHKKEKKDKERKKDKEEEKDGSDEKHKDKKDRKEKHKDKKEKHKDKKKDKEDRGKDKDKSSISEELTVADKNEDISGGKHQPQVQNRDRSGFLKEGRSSFPFQGQNGGKPSQSCLPSQFNEESKSVQELDRRIRADQRGARSQLPEKVALLYNKDQEIVSRGTIRSSSGFLEEENVDNKNERIDKKIDPQGVKNDVTANKMAPNLTPITKAEVEGVAKPVDGQNGKRLEYRERHKETGVIKQGDKQKDRVKESPTYEKEKKKNENAKIKTENKNTNQSLIKNDGSIDPGGFTGKRNMDFSKETNITVANEENSLKRKEYANGFLQESEVRPNKMQRSGPLQFTENRRKIEPFQTPTKSSHDKHTLPNSVRMDKGEKLINGLIDSHKPSTSKSKPCTAIVASNYSNVLGHSSHSANKALKVPNIEDLMAEASRRPPHPDYKHLAEVLTVPKMDWSDLDEQEWLFNKEVTKCYHNMESVRDKEDQHVWSESVHIESADVYALPYVIPY